MHSKLVEVIIINWNGKKFLKGCLDGLKRQTFQDFSIVLVDNGSIDGSVYYVQQNYPEVKIVDLERNTGFCKANNLAVRFVASKYVALLNNDAVPHPDWLNCLMKSMESNPDAGFAASKMLYYENPKTIDRAGDSYTRAGAGLLRGRGKRTDKYNKHEWIFGASAGAAIYRLDMIKKTGLFDEDFFLLYEDVDLSFRAQLQGYKCIYVPDAVVYHKASGTIGYDSAISVYYSHRNLEWVYIQNMPAGLILKSIFSHIIYDVAAFFFFSARGRNKDFIKAKWDALRGIKKALKKRKQIQKNRTVEVDYIWRLLERELFFSRLTRRLK